MKVTFIGHRKVKSSFELKAILEKEIVSLIENEGADTFLFGSKSEFDDICYGVVTNLRKKYPQLKRIYVRAEYEFIEEEYYEYLLSLYEETFFPTEVSGAGAKAYVVRNALMIDESECVIFYYDSKCEPIGRKSGTKIAYNYALKKKKRIINVAAIALT